jgi:hypothetical protein
MLKLFGLVLVIVGLVSGVALVARPFGFVGGTPGLTPWLLFPIGCLGGMILFAVAWRGSGVALVPRVTGGLMLALALLAAVALAMTTAGLLQASSPLTSVWYVLVVGGLAGAGGMLSVEPISARA